MQLPLARPVQVDHISAGKYSLILYSACQSPTLAIHACLGNTVNKTEKKKKKLLPCIQPHHTIHSKTEPEFIYKAKMFQFKSTCNRNIQTQHPTIRTIYNSNFKKKKRNQVLNRLHGMIWLTTSLALFSHPFWGKHGLSWPKAGNAEHFFKQAANWSRKWQDV